MVITVFEVEIGGIARQIESIDQLNDAIKESKKLAEGGLFGSKEQAAASRTLSTLTKVKQDYQKTTRDLVREKTAEDNTYRGLSARLNVMRESYKDLVVQEKANTQEAKNLLAATQQLDTKLKQIDATVGQHQRNVGNYASAFGIAGSAFQLFGKGLSEVERRQAVFNLKMATVTGVVNILTKAYGSAIENIREFDKAQAELAALSGQTREQLSALTEDALKLGSTSLFSAKDVTKLQVELSKLGFDNNQILQMTQAIVDFSVALDVDAAQAATVAASTLKIFGLEASDTERVVSVLGVAANKTSLSFEDFQGNIATFGPVAKSLGFTLEESIALFGSLRDSGFDASTAATSMRNIFLNLADTNGKLAQRLGGSVKSFDQLIPSLIKLRNEGVDLNEALQLTDQRSVAAFSQLLAGAENVDKVRQSITGANEQLGIMADERMNTLDAQTKLLNNQWEAFTVSLDKGNGVLSSVGKIGTQALGNILQALTELNQSKGLYEFGQNLQESVLNVSTLGIYGFISEQFRKEKEAIANESQDLLDVLNKAVEDLNNISLNPFATQKEGPKTLKELREEQKKLSDELEGAVPGTSQYVAIKKDLESITNRISKATQSETKATKDADKAVRERTQKAQEQIRVMQEQLALFETLSGQSAVSPDITLNEDIIADESNRILDLYTERFAVIEKQKQLGLISDASFQTQRIKLEEAAMTEILGLRKRQADQSIESLELELERAQLLSESKIKEGDVITHELLKQEKDRLTALEDQELLLTAEKERSLKLTEGEAFNERIKIHKKYNEERAELDNQYEESQEERLERETARVALEAQNRLELLKTTNATNLQVRLADLDNQYEAEIDAAEKLGAGTADIEQKYANIRKQIIEDEQNAKLAAYSNIAGQLSGLFSEGTAVAKIAAIAQATINAYLSASNTFKEVSKVLPPPFPTIAAGLALAVGLKQVSAIKAIKAEEGVSVSPSGKATTFRPGRIEGPSHAQGGVKGVIHGVPVEAEGGEVFGYDRDGRGVVLNQVQQANLIASSIRNMRLSQPNLLDKYTRIKSDRMPYEPGAVMRAQDGLVVGRSLPQIDPFAGRNLPGFTKEQLEQLKQVMIQGSREGSMIGSAHGIRESSKEALREERFRNQNTIG